MISKHGRHTPAFILLFLAEAPAYGAELLSKMEKDLPHCFSDSAIVYRSLQELLKNGCVEATWRETKTGQPRKWYAITEKGEQMLRDQADDIRRRLANFQYFLEHYQALTAD